MVTRSVASSEDLRRRLAAGQKLSAYAQIALELHEVPEGSLERLMARIAQQKNSAAMPVTISRKSDGSTMQRHAAQKILPWIGCAIAAGMMVTAGKLYQNRAALNSMLTAQTGRVEHMSTSATEVDRERNTLSANMAEQAKELSTLRNAAAAEKNDAAALRTTVAKQTIKANELTALAANAARERDVLRGDGGGAGGPGCAIKNPICGGSSGTTGAIRLPARYCAAHLEANRTAE